MKFSSFFIWQKLDGNRRLFVLCLFLFVVSTCFSFWIFFPADVVQRRLLQKVSTQTGIEVRGKNAAMLLPLGLELDLTIYPDVKGIADLKLDDLQITPLWTQLFSSAPAIQLRGKLASGELNGSGSRNGDADLTFNNIQVLKLQQVDQPYRIEGTLSGELHGEKLSERLAGHGSFSCILNGGEIIGLKRVGLPDRLEIGSLRLSGQFNQRRVSLEKVLLSGGALDLSGGGNILVGETPKQTRLNLNIRLQPTASTPDMLIDMLKLTGVRPTTDGSYLLRIGGTLAKPVVR